MLMRSSSTAMLKSCAPQSSPEPEFPLQIALKLSSSYSSISFDYDCTINKISSTHLITSCMHHKFLLPLEDGEQDTKEMASKTTSRAAVEVVVGGGAGVGVGSGGGSGGCGGGDGGYGWRWDANSSMDAYYECMIESDPSNSMLLTNYATFLKEIRGDFEKAEVYCGRAILANPSSGNALSLYGDLIWQNYEDAKRAHIYFDRAVKSAPDNSYIMASYARFLWDAEDEIEDQQCTDHF